MNPDSTQAIIEKMLTTTPPAFSAAAAVDIAARHYGIQATVHPLVSERDQNFRLDAGDGKRFTLKVSNHAEQQEVIDFQNRALIHAEKQDPSLPLPRVIRTLDGQQYCQVESGGKTHFVRVLSWLDGVVLDVAAVDAGLAKDLGRLLAHFGLALEDFDHPGSNPPLLWDMKRASRLSELVVYIKESGPRLLIDQTLDKFVVQVKPKLDKLRTQVIHNDMNPGNILVDKARSNRIRGLIDFADLVKSPLIIDLAVAAAYQLRKGDDPLAGALPMIAGYHAIRPLHDLEMELLLDLIRTRLITSILIGTYRATLFPENSEYLLISQNSTRNFLLSLNRQNSELALERIRKVCVSR
jgi:Ser/Thr protein kinase RdoA (MazF antagonist)